MTKINQLESANSTLLDEQAATTLIVRTLEADKRVLGDKRNQLISQIAFLQGQVEDLKNSESDAKLKYFFLDLYSSLFFTKTSASMYSERSLRRRWISP